MLNATETIHEKVTTAATSASTRVRIVRPQRSAVAPRRMYATRPMTFAVTQGATKGYCPLITASVVLASEITKFAPYLATPAPDLSTVMRDTAFGLRDRGWFDPAKGFKKLGLLYDECAPEVNKTLDEVNKTYVELAGRGRDYVARVRGQEATKQTKAAASSTATKAKTTATQAKKTAKTTSSSAKATGTTTKKTATKAAKATSDAAAKAGS